MEIDGVITAIIVGIVVGVLGRLVVPGRQNIGFLLTVAVGILAGLVGAALSENLMTDPSFFITLVIQVLLAAVFVAITAKLTGKDGKKLTHT